MIFASSIVKRLVLKFMALAIIFGGVYGVFDSRNVDSISLKWFGLGFLIIFLLSLLFVFFDIVRPFKVVLGQMQALIAGKPYKRIYTNRTDEVGVLAHFFNQVTKGLGEASHDIQDRERMLDELTIAAQLQRDILPVNSPAVRGLQIIAKNKPATELGGDIFNFITVKGKTFIYIGDVTGHGVAAGLVMTMATSLITVFADMYNSPFDILVNVNRHIKRHIKKAMFLTLVMLCWDEEKQEMSYVGAGHEHILIYRANSGECQVILSGGIALGMLPDNSKAIKEQKIELSDGDFIVLYSDGIIEAKNAQGEMYGLERLKKNVVEFAPQYSSEGVNYHIAQEVSAFTQGHGQDDDMSLIVIRRDKSLKGVEITDKTTNWA